MAAYKAREHLARPAGAFEKFGEDLLKAKIESRDATLGQSEHEQNVLWLRERRDIAERRDRTLRWIALTAALFAILSFAAAVYFGFYPRPPIEASLDPDTVYRDGVAIGHVSAFNVEPVLAGQYVFQVEASKPIDKGDMLRFRRAVCFVVDLGQPPRQLPNKLILFNGISCRVVGD